VALAVELQPLIDALERRLRPIGLPSQLVHGDITGNVLFAQGRPPAVIDFSPIGGRPGTPWRSRRSTCCCGRGPHPRSLTGWRARRTWTSCWPVRCATGWSPSRSVEQTMPAERRCARPLSQWSTWCWPGCRAAPIGDLSGRRRGCTTGRRGPRAAGCPGQCAPARPGCGRAHPGGAPHRPPRPGHIGIRQGGWARRSRAAAVRAGRLPGARRGRVPASGGGQLAPAGADADP
jgi:hypothetical protein